MQKVISKLKDQGYKAAFINELRQSYEKALEDKDFTDLVTILNMPKEELMKYTSILKSCALEYSHCQKCKGLMECPNAMNGYAYLPRVFNHKLLFENKICQYNKKLLTEQAYLKNVTTFDLQSDVREASIKKIYVTDKKRFAAIEWVHKFLKTYKKNPHQKGLYLNGSFGCGKTYLISALFNDLAKDGIKSTIIFWPEFLRDLKTSFQTDFKEKFEFVKKTPLLLIDDIGAESMTEWNRDEIFCPIVQYRMQEKLPTFFTSNFNLEGLELHFASAKNSDDVVKSRRIIERIKQLTDNVEMISCNLRK